MTKRESQIHNAIIKTLCYADVFDFPLTQNEIIRYIIWEEKIKAPSIGEISSLLKKKNTIFHKIGKYYSLQGREYGIQRRKIRKKWYKNKYSLAKKIGYWIYKVPTVKAVAITGGLAMENAKKTDDIDLMVITSEKRLWVTRFLVVLVVSVLAKRRKPVINEYHTHITSDAFCLNLLLEENSLSVPTKKRNLYTAHEVIQAKFLYEKDGIMRQFHIDNIWVSTYLPHSITESVGSEKNQNKGNYLSSKTSIIIAFLDRLNKIAFYIQYWYMRRKKTKEYVTRDRAYFHPRDTASIVLKQYDSRLKRILYYQ